ncbi:MAG TPA: sigma-70 family RNA polymerase sigma factor, partial [Kofleriaceae bacterium]|nr:sigma-70 family RNA polymerase sigma factor [Kofleriaceae bacterium]
MPTDRRQAGEWLVRTYAGEVLGLCTAMVRDRAAAEDLTQEVFGAAFAALGEFRGDASVRTWILAIARNRCIDHLRARKREPFPGGDDGDLDAQPDEAPLPGDLLGRRDQVEAALAALA